MKCDCALNLETAEHRCDLAAGHSEPHLCHCGASWTVKRRGP